ncbi:hypothetical protein TYRP_017253 [Tyrophagus putrescentiae]|nr:hypothetical protein TYRP_017253 [Tyrophagus putrescentiae]
MNIRNVQKLVDQLHPLIAKHLIGDLHLLVLQTPALVFEDKPGKLLQVELPLEKKGHWVPDPGPLDVDVPLALVAVGQVGVSPGSQSRLRQVLHCHNVPLKLDGHEAATRLRATVAGRRRPLDVRPGDKACARVGKTVVVDVQTKQSGTLISANF